MKSSKKWDISFYFSLKHSKKRNDVFRKFKCSDCLLAVVNKVQNREIQIMLTL